MNKLKYKLLSRYKKCEAFLKVHPFLPNFLSNGGLLAILFIVSIVFTIVCGRLSTRDINPVLKVVELSIQGKQFPRLSKIGIYHDINEDVQDLLWVEYGMTEKKRDTNYDDRQFKTDIRKAGLYYHQDSILINEFVFKTDEPHNYLSNNYNMQLGKAHKQHFTVTYSNTGSYYRQYNLCERRCADTTKFKNSFEGNFISPNRNNPFIYMHFKMDGDL